MLMFAFASHQSLSIIDCENMSIDQLKSRLSHKYQQNNVLQLPESLFIRALNACLSNLDAAESLISNYIETKKSQPYFFTQLQDDQYNEVFGKMYSTVSSRSKDDQLILSFNVARWDPSSLKLTDLLSTINLTLQCLSLEENKVNCGVNFIVDTSGMGFKYVQAVKPLVIREFFQFMFMSCPANINLIIGYNCNSIVDLIYGAVKPFLPKSITERVIIMSQDYQKLSQYLGEDLVANRRHIANENDVREFINLIEKNKTSILDEWKILDKIMKDTE